MEQYSITLRYKNLVDAEPDEIYEELADVLDQVEEAACDLPDETDLVIKLECTLEPRDDAEEDAQD